MMLNLRVNQGVTDLIKRYRLSVLFSFVALLAIMFVPSRMLAQASGSISGRVSDETGALIPDATITLTNQATAAVRNTVSTSSGDYVFPAVAPGTYIIRVSHATFKTATSQNIEVQVSQALRQNFTLQVGAAVQTVTVRSSGALLQVESASLGQVGVNLSKS